MADDSVFIDPPPEYRFRPACGEILEDGTGVMVSGMTFGFKEIDTVGRSYKELTDVLAEVERDGGQVNEALTPLLSLE